MGREGEERAGKGTGREGKGKDWNGWFRCYRMGLDVFVGVTTHYKKLLVVCVSYPPLKTLHYWGLEDVCTQKYHMHPLAATNLAVCGEDFLF